MARSHMSDDRDPYSMDGAEDGDLPQERKINTQKKSFSFETQGHLSDNCENNDPFDTIDREIRELDRRLLEHHIRSNKRETYSGSTYHNNRKEGSNPKNMISLYLIFTGTLDIMMKDLLPLLFILIG